MFSGFTGLDGITGRSDHMRSMRLLSSGTKLMPLYLISLFILRHSLYVIRFASTPILEPAFIFLINQSANVNVSGNPEA